MSRPDRQASGRALTSAPITTAAGIFTAHFSERGLAELDFPNRASRASNSTEELREPYLAWLLLTTEAVTAILSGKEPTAFPPLDLGVGSAFQQRVWLALRGIPIGETKTYGEIAREVGEPEATRAVGSACGANPIPLLVPCHRVVASGGNLGGFSGGLEWKRRLLAIEGVKARAGELPW